MNWLSQKFVKLFHQKFPSSVAQSSFKLYFGLIKLKLIFVNSQYSPIVVLFTLDQYFFIDNIAGTIPFASLLLSNGKLNMPWRPHSRDTDIKLPMWKEWVIQPNTNIQESLSLRLVDCHCKCHSNRKLPMTSLKWILSIFRPQSYPWNQDLSCFMLSTSYRTLEKMDIVHFIED